MAGELEHAVVLAVDCLCVAVAVVVVGVVVVVVVFAVVLVASPFFWFIT